jgi:hypothetical protein
VTTVSAFERFIFAVTRLLIGLTALGATLAIVLCILFLVGKFDKPTNVSYAEVKQALEKSAVTEDEAEVPVEKQDTGSGYSVPPNLSAVFVGDNRKVLGGWMKRIESEHQREQFLSELSNVVSAAQAEGKNPAASVNTYKELKFKKIDQSDFQKYQALAAKAGVAAVLYGLVFLLVILALALVLMAIERHGRRISFAIGEMQMPTNNLEGQSRTGVGMPLR